MTALQQILMSAVESRITFLGSQGNTVAAGGSTINFTQTLQQGDLVLVMYASDNVTALPTIGSGYTDLASNAALGTPDYAIRYKIMGATPDTSIAIGAADSAQASPVVIMFFRGVNQTTPIDTTTQVSSSGGILGLPNPPSITTVTRNAVVVAIGFLDDVAITAASLTGYNNVTFATGSATAGATASAAAGWLQKSTPGAEDPPTFTMTGANDEWTGATVALRPA